MREERRLLRLSTARVDNYIEALKLIRKENWFHPEIETNQSHAKRILLNVGGLVG
jgi:hypothetical protein